MNVTFTSEEIANILLDRLEKNVGKTMPADLRAAVLRYMSGDAVAIRVADDDARPTTKRPAQDGDKRTTVHMPTTKAKRIDRPTSDEDRVINQIIDSGMCTNKELMSSLKIKYKALSSVLWRLHESGLVRTDKLVNVLAKQHAPAKR